MALTRRQARLSRYIIQARRFHKERKIALELIQRGKEGYRKAMMIEGRLHFKQIWKLGEEKELAVAVEYGRALSEDPELFKEAEDIVRQENLK